MLNKDEEDFVKNLYAENQKAEQIKVLSDTMWLDVQALKDGSDKDKWTKIVARKQKFYADREEVSIG